MREEEKKQSSRKLGLKRFFNKRWAVPAVYVLAAAIILSSFLYFQNRGNEDVKDTEDQFGYENNTGENTDDALEVTNPMETFEWPVTNPDEVEVVTPFYDAAASEEEQEAALLYYGNSFQPNTGIDIVAKDGETFDVVAAMSGTVESVEEDAMLGNVVVLQHADGIKTHYSSVKDIQVSVGDKVQQGEKLANAGKSLVNEEAGIHTHFEIRKNDVPVNPLEYFKKSLETLQEADQDSTPVQPEQDEQEEGGGDVDEDSDEPNTDNNR